MDVAGPGAEAARRPFLLAGLIAGAAIAFRLSYILATGLQERVETFEYEEIALNILAGRGFGIQHFGTWYRSFGGVIFTYLSAVLYAAFGHSHLVILVVQALFAAVAVLACFHIGCRLFSPGVGLFASTLVAFHPGLFFYDTHKLHPLSLDATLAAVGFLMTLVLRAPRSWRSPALAGILHGVAIFERGTDIGLLGIALVSLRRATREGARARWIAVYLAAAAAVPSLWVVRNFFVYHRPVLRATSSAEVFWRGNNPVASGGAFAEGRPGVPVFDAAPRAFRREIRGRDEVTQSRLFRQEAVAYILDHPSGALRLFGRKLLIFWWFSADSGFLYPAAYLRIYKGYYLVVLALALLGIGVACRPVPAKARWESLSLIAFLVSVSLVQAAFYVEIRHRWSVELLLLIFSSRGSIFLAYAGRRFAQYNAC